MSSAGGSNTVSLYFCVSPPIPVTTNLFAPLSVLCFYIRFERGLSAVRARVITLLAAACACDRGVVSTTVYKVRRLHFCGGYQANCSRVLKEASSKLQFSGKMLRVACARSWDFLKTGLAVFQGDKAGPDTVLRS